ncbi:MAG: adenosylmethionine--8-amino-7-oxononanoate transaminase [Planctomycetes bacterium]|nr:adenosylmethionine--8-amino-7-oxononanoate transaminase [Planctomycetota bacterium]
MSAPSAARTRRLRDADKAHLWHPFTQMAEWAAGEPVVIEAGEREFLIDTDGRRYIDGVASLWCNLHGHRRPELDEAVRRQLGRIAHSTLLGLTSAPAIELAERLVGIAPRGLTRVFYSDSGAAAVEIALKMAFQYWRQCARPEPQRTKFAGLALGYHGDTLGAVSVGGIDVFHGIFRPLLFECIRAPAPYCYRCPLGKRRESCGMACADALEQVLASRGREVAALILEPLVQGAGGMIVHPEGYLGRAAEACRRHNVLLIADEVATGFGRTGRMFACEHEGVRPDIMCLGKGISGGYLPLAATLATERIYEAFLGGPAENRTFFHGHTYTGNALACAAGLASLDIFEKDRVLDRIAGLSARLGALLEPLAAMLHVGEVRRRGLMAGIELAADRATRAAYPPAERRGRQACLAARERGVWLRPLGDVAVIMPPYCISDESLARLVEAVRMGIEEATAT